MKALRKARITPLKFVHALADVLARGERAGGEAVLHRALTVADKVLQEALLRAVGRLQPGHVQPAYSINVDWQPGMAGLVVDELVGLGDLHTLRIGVRVEVDDERWHLCRLEDAGAHRPFVGR